MAERGQGESMVKRQVEGKGNRPYKGVKKRGICPLKNLAELGHQSTILVLRFVRGS